MNRIKRITNFLIDMDKVFNMEVWDNAEGTDICVDNIIISVPNDDELVISFENKDKSTSENGGKK